MNDTSGKSDADQPRLPEDEHVDPGAAAAWEAEIARRVAELDAGTAKTMSCPEARRRILEDADAPSRD